MILYDLELIQRMIQELIQIDQKNLFKASVQEPIIMIDDHYDDH